MLKCFGCFVTARNSFKINSISVPPPRVRFVPEHERIQIDTTYQEFNRDEFDAAELYDPTSPPPIPEIELSSSNDLANSTASSGFDYLPRGPAQILYPKFTNPDQLTAGSCYF